MRDVLFYWLCFPDSLIVWIPTECCVSKNDSNANVNFKFETLIVFQLLVKVTPRRTCKRIFSSQHQSLIGRVIQQPLGIGRLLAFIIKMYHPIPCKLICWFITLVFPRKIHAAWKNNWIQKVFPCCIILFKVLKNRYEWYQHQHQSPPSSTVCFSLFLYQKATEKSEKIKTRKENTKNQYFLHYIFISQGR